MKSWSILWWAERKCSTYYPMNFRWLPSDVVAFPFMHQIIWNPLERQQQKKILIKFCVIIYVSEMVIQTFGG